MQLANRQFLKRIFHLSTSVVDNDVDKSPLTGRRASTGAGFNKMPVSQAKSTACKIKHLQMGLAGRPARPAPPENLFLAERRAARRAVGPAGTAFDKYVAEA